MKNNLTSAIRILFVLLLAAVLLSSCAHTPSSGMVPDDGTVRDDGENTTDENPSSEDSELISAFENGGDVVLPSDTKSLFFVNYREIAKNPVTSVTFPAEFNLFEVCPLGLDTILNYYVAEDHPDLISADGVLFSKDMTKLFAFPEGRTGSYVIPDTVTYIDSSAFAGTLLEEIYVPDSVIFIDDHVFEGGARLKKVSLPKSFQYLSGWFFGYGDLCCENLMIEYRGSYADLAQLQFLVSGDDQCYANERILCTEDESALTAVFAKGGDVVIPEGMAHFAIDYPNIAETPVLSVTFPNDDSVSSPYSMKSAKPLGVNSILNYYVSENHPTLVSVDGVLFTKDMTELVAFPEGRTGSYTIPDSVTRISSCAFSHSSLEEIRIPETVTYIGHYAFRSCLSLKTVSLPKWFECDKDATLFDVTTMKGDHLTILYAGSSVDFAVLPVLYPSSYERENLIRFGQ